MTRVLAKDVRGAAEAGASTVRVSGWVHRIRDMGGVSFVMLRDRSGIVQVVLDKKPQLTLESVISAEGHPVLNAKAPGGAEIHTSKVEVLSSAAAGLPFQVNGSPEKTSLAAILDNRGLSLRNPKILSIFKVQSTIIDAYAKCLRGEDFTEIKTSKLVGGSTEGGAELFSVNYFDRLVWLAQSPQAYKETLAGSGLERVFEIAPAYRAEKHDTPRHLSEYVSLDLEMAFIDSEHDLINLEKRLLSYIFDEVAAKNAADLEVWGVNCPSKEQVTAAPVVPYEKAVEIAAKEAEKQGQKSKFYDITPEVERILCEWAEKEHGIPLVFVNEFPRRLRPFYTYPLDNARTMSFDALFRGIEITTGGRRHHDYQTLYETLPRFGLDPANMGAYLAMLKYGCPPHGGFATGLERLTQKILGLANVKEASLFPRDRKRVSP